jgi:hypothetical protein
MAKWDFVAISLSAAKPKCPHSSWVALSEVLCVQLVSSQTAKTYKRGRLAESVFVNLRPSVTFGRAVTQKAELWISRAIE